MKRYNRIDKIGKEKFQQYASEVFSIAQILEKLGYSKKAGGAYSVAKKYLQIYQIDTSHWTGAAWNKGQQLKDWAKYSNHQSCKKHLIAERSHRCELCGLKEWREQPIPLEVHHKDGNRTNNEYDNLQLLCPNCHAMTDTWKGRNIKQNQNNVDANAEADLHKKNNCLVCNSATANKKYCSSVCYHKSTKNPKLEKRKVFRPSLSQLKKDLENMSFVSVGKKYGVSDNCIRKWLKLEISWTTIDSAR